MIEKNGYILSRQWHEFAIRNQDKATITHAGIMFYLIELNNSLDWMPKFGLPTVHSMAATNIKSYKTFKKCIDDLMEWGFIKLHQKATNNHTANIIELVLFTNSDTNSFTKSIPSQVSNQFQVNDQLSVDIDKPETKKPETLKLPKGVIPYDDILSCFNSICTSLPKVQKLSTSRKEKIKVRWSDIGSLEKFEEVFRKVQDTPFLIGENNTNWRADFDWLIENDKNWLKVLEGKYDKSSQNGSNKINSSKTHAGCF